MGKRYTGQFRLKFAEPQDAPECVRLGKMMFEESHFAGITEYSLTEASLEPILQQNPDNTYVNVVAEIAPDRLVGYCVIGLNYLYTRDPWACLDMFYVEPEYRKSPIPRALAKAAVQSAKSLGAVAFFANSISGSKASASMINLFKKLGFEETHSGLKLVLGDTDG